MLLPYVMRFNLPTRQKAFGRIAELLGEETSGMDALAAAERAILAVESLRQRIGIPTSISQLGGREDQLAGFAEKAYAVKRLMHVNPRPVTLVDLETILHEAF